MIVALMGVSGVGKTALVQEPRRNPRHIFLPACARRACSYWSPRNNDEHLQS
jgi:hypothetical protein